ncbi:MAG: NAD-dependent epimerase/dehydratase family protein [Carbonactinosporaceae bacterium]
MRILVTGGAGFIGSHLVECLAVAGHEVRVLDDLSASGGPAGPPAGRSGGLPGGLPAEFVTADIRDREAVARAMTGMDAVCHHAAAVGLGVDLSDLPRFADVNVNGTAVLLAAMNAARVPRLVLASSMVVYGEGGYDCARHGRVHPMPRERCRLEAGHFEALCPRCEGVLVPVEVDEGDLLDPRSGYAVTKLAQEQLAATWARESGGVAVALRYHNVYGPRMPRDTPYAGVAAIFCSALARGLPPQVHEDGRQRRDFVHVRDVARAGRLALDTALASELPEGALRAYNVASGEPRTVGEMAAALAEAYRGPAPEVTGRYRLGDIRHIMASPRRAAGELGYRAGVPFADGMREMAGWGGGLTSRAAGVPRTGTPARHC